MVEGPWIPFLPQSDASAIAFRSCAARVALYVISDPSLPTTRGRTARAGGYHLSQPAIGLAPCSSCQLYALDAQQKQPGRAGLGCNLRLAGPVMPAAALSLTLLCLLCVGAGSTATGSCWEPHNGTGWRSSAPPAQVNSDSEGLARF